MLFVTIIAILISVLVLLGLSYLIALKPARVRTSWIKPFTDTKIAHRGLHDNKSVPENSYEAFENAIEFGYGIELDVQMTSDNKLVVFHDDKLKRMCRCSSRLSKLTYDEISSRNLLDTNCKIPLFADVLRLVDGKVPLVIEIKTHVSFLRTAAEVALLLDTYKGPFCIESFNPIIVNWYKRNRPDFIRGILASNYLLSPRKTLTQRLLVTNLLFNGYCKPDFVAYNHIYSSQPSLRLCRNLFKCTLVAWTVRSQEELDKASEFFDVYIFEQFIPK